MNKPRLLVLHAAAEGRTLSYQTGWPRALAADPRVEVRLADLASRRGLLTARFARADLVVLLHSVFANSGYMPEWLIDQLARSPVPTVWFIGNEYKLMPEKMTFADQLNLDVLVTQIDNPAVTELYRQRLGCSVVPIPNTGLDTSLFRPVTPQRSRPIDVGYRAYDGVFYLGHDERGRLATAVRAAAAGRDLVLDVSLDPGARFTEPQWAEFLDRCKGQVGFEAGSDFFELDDRSRKAVEAHLAANPDATFAEVYERFFAQYDAPVSGRALSGRIVEAAGTKTVQLLIEGRYGGFFEPNVHYIPLRKDLSNMDEALDRLADPASAVLADNAYEVAVSELTYDRLIGRFLEAVEPVL